LSWRFLTRILIDVDAGRLLSGYLGFELSQLLASLASHYLGFERAIFSKRHPGLGATDFVSSLRPQRDQCRYEADNDDGDHYRPNAKPHVLAPARNDLSTMITLGRRQSDERPCVETLAYPFQPSHRRVMLPLDSTKVYIYEILA
jgi:hypothetical protein